MLLLVLLGSWWGVRRRDRAAEQEAEAEHLLAGAGNRTPCPAAGSRCSGASAPRLPRAAGPAWWKAA
ncbi:hypothetical protein NIA69_19390 [Gemmiger formicilis]|nr:hypothetical protein [Gemmiger formicilis]